MSNKFTLSMNWIRAHKFEYAGNWVALNGVNLIDFDRNKIVLHERIKNRSDLKELILIKILDEKDIY